MGFKTVFGTGIKTTVVGPNVLAEVDFGAGAGEACEGDDARLSNARTPSAHAASHAPGGGDALAADQAAGVASPRTLGTGAQQACAGNDARFVTAMNSAARDALTPAVGQTIYNTDLLCLQAWNGTRWSGQKSGVITLAFGEAILTDTDIPSDARVIPNLAGVGPQANCAIFVAQHTIPNSFQINSANSGDARDVNWTAIW